MLDRLREGWQSRTAQERVLIAVGVSAVTIAALWAYVWVPIEAERARLITSVPKLRAQTQLLARDASDVARLRAAASSRGDTSPPAGAVEEAIRSAGLGEAGTAALGEGRVQVNLGVVPFDPLIRALAQLAQAHGLAVDTISLKAAGEPGKVRVETLILKGARSG